MKDVNAGVAELVYEQMCGSSSGHMAMIPNNPMLYTTTKIFSNRNDNVYSMSKTEFVDFLRSCADSLDND